MAKSTASSVSEQESHGACFGVYEMVFNQHVDNLADTVWLFDDLKCHNLAILDSTKVDQYLPHAQHIAVLSRESEWDYPVVH